MITGIAEQIRGLIDESGVDESKIAGLGVAVPGPIDLNEGSVVEPPLLTRWNRVSIREALAEATGLETLVDKDVTSAAVAETWAGGVSGAGSFVFMYMGTGIGCGLVLNDEVVRGTSGNAGEIGHIIVDPDGPECDCGLRGCVKSSCIPQVLVAEAEAQGVLDGHAEARTLRPCRNAMQCCATKPMPAMSGLWPSWRSRRCWWPGPFPW